MTSLMRKLAAKFQTPWAVRQEFRQLQRDGRVEVGRHTYGLPRVVTFDGDDTRLIVGAFVSIAQGVTFILGGNHPTDRFTTYPLRRQLQLRGVGSDGFPFSKGDVVIEDDVWIGFGVTVLSGVRVGRGSVVAACSVVTRNVPPYSLVAGSPASVRRARLTPTQIEVVEQSQWWTWSDEEIGAHVDLLTSRPAPAVT